MVIDVLRATFPAGTVSGAPKVRAMEIIDELEPVKRGVYAGAVGYLGFHGNMDVAIALRTAVIKNGTLYVQAGGGSSPTRNQRPSGRKPRARQERCCARRRWLRPGWILNLSNS